MKIKWDGGSVSSDWQRPKGQAKACLVLAHGSSGGMNTPLIIDVGNNLTKRGISVLRFNFPYIESGKKSPDSSYRLESCFRAAANIASMEKAPLFLGGKSLGARIALQISNKGTAANGLIFLGYPLHPPGKPDKAKLSANMTPHLPMLFIQGSNDPFAKSTLIKKITSDMNQAKLVHIDGGNHSLSVPKRDPREVIDDIGSSIESFLSLHLTPNT